MNKIIKEKIAMTTPKQWDNQWENIFQHYQQDTRHAYYIRAILNANEHKLLEIGAGSFRDMAKLNSWNINCDGIDYSKKAVELAKNQFPQFASKIKQMDAFNIDVQDKLYDFTFHNGLWVYFSDKDIIRLVNEQARITKRRMVVTVHNAHNQEFIEYFEKLSENDALYKIRFFKKDEIMSLMEQTCSRVTVIPVGKGKKYFEDDLINLGLGDACNLRKSFEYHGMNLIENSERLLCIGDIK